MMYHLLTGDLPFDMPLAFRQMQFHDVLPALPDYADTVTEVLRRGTSEEPAFRPESAQAIMHELEAALAGAIDLTGLDAPFAGPVGFATDDANLREAVDIYTRAHHAWAGGQGRFLLGVTHFMLMNDYYLFADRHGLEIDLEGRQMLLRGALEYDRDIEHWWDQLDDSNRRWVCLHAVRSENAPARVRALQRLEALPDSEPLRIPRLVAQALQVETDEQAQLAELAVLSARARLVKPAEKIDAPAALHSVMLTSLTRFERRAAPEQHWHETVYTPEIDTLIASTALTSAHAAVRDTAARVIGRIRSLMAVSHLVERLAKRQRYAARALALVRDEAPNLPPIVPPRDRLRAWLVNTARRLTENPLQLTWRFLFALIGAALGMGVQVFVTYRSQAIFEPDRVTNTYAFGLGFGLMIGILTLLADEIPSRLRGFWGWPARTALSVALGLAWGTLTWGAVSYMYLRQTFINWELMFIGGLGLALGFVLTTALSLRGWLAVLVTALLAYLPILFVWHNVCWQYGICSDWPAFSIAPAMLPGLLIGLFAGALLRLQSRAPITLPVPPRVNGVIGVLSGAALACVSWLAYAAVLAGGPPTWTGIGLLVGLGIAWGALIYVFNAPGRLGFALASVALFVGLMLQVTPLLQDPASMPVVGGEYIDFLLFYDEPLQLITATVPFALLIALGAYAMQLARDLRWFRPRRAVDEPAPEPRTGDISQLETWQMIGGESGGKSASDSPAERGAPKPAALFGNTRIIDRDAPASEDSDTRRLRDEDR
jgi:hypothetical protein